MNPQQIRIPFQRPFADALLPSAGSASVDPILYPLTDGDLVGFNMFAGVARSDQASQLLPRLADRALKGFGEALAVDAIA
jgi:hypothetical protein